MNRAMLFIKKPKKLAIEISDWLKIAESSFTPSGYRISKLKARKILDIKDSLSSGIKEFLKGMDIKTKQVTLIIPRHLVSIRNLELPSTDEKEIREIIDLQISKHTPYSREEIIFGFKVNESFKDGYSQVLLAIVKKSIIEERIKVLKEAGLETISVRVSSEMAYQILSLLNKDIQNKTTLFIDIDSCFSDTLVIRKGNFEYTRNISVGKDFIIKNPSDWKERFVEEVKKSLEIYQHDYGDKNIEKMVFSGATDGLADLLTMMRIEFNVSIDMINLVSQAASYATDKITISLAEAINNISLSSLFGVLCSDKEPSINLLPHDIELERQVRDNTKNITYTGILGIFILMLVSVFLLERFYMQKYYYDLLHTKYLKTEKESGDVETTKIRVNIIREYLDKKNSVVNVLRALLNVTPSEIYFSNINYTKNREVILTGTSQAMSDVFKLVSLLEGLDYFEKVKTHYATKNKKVNKEVVDFEIVCPIVP